MIKKIITFFIIIIWILFFWYSYWIEDNEWIVNNIFQDSINKNFEPIDKRAEEILINLNSQKNYCFGYEKQMNFTECVDYMEKVFSINSEEFVIWENGYAKACEKSLVETIEKTSEKAISSVDVKTILKINWNSKTCSELYAFKLAIYKQVAYDILKKNKYFILKDEQKKYVQENRKKYDNLDNLIRVNLSYIERLWKKWPSKTKK